MPVSCQLRGDKWRICEPDDSIAKTADGHPRDGGGHETEEDCQIQARAMNKKMMTVSAVTVLRRWSLGEMDPDANGHPVEIIYVGTFHLADRNRVLEVTQEHLDQMVKNFRDLDGPDRVAFNINHNSHAATLDEARAVGWLQDLFVRESDGRISLMGAPRWLADARERLAEEQFKFLSAEIDFNATNFATGDKCGCRLLGIAITNTPAIPDLSPIQLTSYADGKTWRDWGLARLLRLAQVAQGDSLVEKINRLVDAFFRNFPDSNIESYSPEDIRDKCLIVYAISGDGLSRQLYQVDYQDAAEGVVFSPREQWIKVEQQYVPLRKSLTANTDKEVTKETKAVSPSTSAAESGTQRQEIVMDELRKLLNISAGDSLEEAIVALKTEAAKVAELAKAKESLEAQVVQLMAQVKQAATIQHEKEDAEAALTSKGQEVMQLSTQVSAYKGEMEKLAQEVKRLTEVQHSRETEDRIDLALRKGQATRAELDANKGYLRGLAGEQPSVFDNIMLARVERPELFVEVGANGDPAPDANLDEIFRLVQDEKKIDPGIADDIALQRVFSKRPDLEKLQYEGGK